MKKEQYVNLTSENIIILDGATGSELMKYGMPKGVCAEKWVIENPEVILKIQSEYVNAGSKIILAPTFSANRISLKEYGLENRIPEMIKELVSLSKKAAALKAYVAGDITMTGAQIEPIGDFKFEELIDIYKEQIKELVNSGVDLLIIETMISLQETRAALIAAKETCDLPVMATMTFTDNMTTSYGTSPEAAIIVLQSLGADAIGVNCSVGPEGMLEIVQRMSKYSKVPIIAKPNAGIPKVDTNGNTVYEMSPQDFSDQTLKLVEAGASIIGGCCGTSAEYISMLNKKVKEYSYKGYPKSELNLISNYKYIFNNEKNNVSDYFRIEDNFDDLDLLLELIDDNQDKFMVTSITNPIILEKALRHYSGRALYDNNIQLNGKIVEIINKYGALIKK